MRVVVTRIEHDGTMHRRMVDTAQQTNPRDWEDLAARALVLVSDGPFAETKEQIAGFDLIEGASMAEAAEIASQHPTARIGTFELRQIWDSAGQRGWPSCPARSGLPRDGKVVV